MKKVINIISIIEGVIFTILSFFLIILFRVINILPDNYFLLLALSLVVICLIIDFFLLFNFKNKVYRVLKYLFLVLTIILATIYSYGIYTLDKTLNIFSNILTLNEEVTNYYLIVLSSSNYEESSDLYNKTLGYYTNTEEEVLTSIKLDLIYQEENDINELKNKLLDKKVDAILVSGIILNLYEESDSTFSSQIKIIDTIGIRSELKDITKKVSIKNTPFNILISGIDTYGDINITSRNDVNIVVTINPNTNEILLTWIPRDYYVTLHGTSGYKDKLTHASYYGINMNIQTVEDILDIDINYYVKVNFTTVVELVDEIDGIDIYSDRDLNIGDCTIKEGINHLNGKCALAYSRERHSYADGDRHRGRNQQEVITSIFEKLSQGTTIISEYNNIISVLDGKFATDINLDEFSSFIKHELNDLPLYSIKSIQLDGYGDMGKTYTYPNQDLWIMIPDEETITKAKSNINEVLNNKN